MTGQATDPWVRRFAHRVRDAWAWARSRHLPALLSVVALVLLLIAERKLLKEVLHAQEGLRDALAELKLTVNDELGAARKALEDTRVLENDIRSRLDIVHGRELTDVPVLARALKEALDAGVGRARDVASALGVPGDSATRPGARASMQAELASLNADLVELARRVGELGQRANEAELALGGGTDGGVRGFPNVQAQASRIAQRLSEAEAIMFARDTAGGADAAPVSRATLSQAGRPGEPFPPLYARAKEISLGLDRSFARLFGDGGPQEFPDVARKLHDIQARLQSFQARLDRMDEALRAEETVPHRGASPADAGTPEMLPSTVK